MDLIRDEEAVSSTRHRGRGSQQYSSEVQQPTAPDRPEPNPAKPLDLGRDHTGPAGRQFTPKRSLVRTQYRPPQETAGQSGDTASAESPLSSFSPPARKLWTVDEVLDFAEEAGLDRGEAAEALRERRYRAQVEADPPAVNVLAG